MSELQIYEMTSTVLQDITPGSIVIPHLRLKDAQSIVRVGYANPVVGSTYSLMMWLILGNDQQRGTLTYMLRRGTSNCVLEFRTVQIWMYQISRTSSQDTAWRYMIVLRSDIYRNMSTPNTTTG